MNVKITYSHIIICSNGGWDLVAELSVCDLRELDRVLRDVRETNGILNSETSILLSPV
jgi:hypothetical protein